MTIRAGASLRALGIALLCLQAASPAVAQSESPTPRRTGTDAAAGASLFVPQRWGTVGVTVVNPAERSADVLSVHSFGDNAGLQFGRQLWVPPGARRTTWYPLLPPESTSRGMSLPVQSLLIDRSHGAEVLLKSPDGSLTHDGLLPSQPGNDPVTGLLADPTDVRSAVLAQVARAALHLPIRLASLDVDRLPPAEESLHTLDHLIVASDRLAEKPAALRAVRRWLHGGGRAWVRLDHVSPATVSLLLGQDFACTVVGRVGLTRWQLHTEGTADGPAEAAFRSATPLTVPGGPAAAVPEERIDRFEPPVDMVRVIVPGARPVHTIDGWPASFWRRAGRGWILFTTLGPRGWVSPRLGDGRRGQDAGEVVSDLEAGEPLRQLAFAFLKRKAGPPLDTRAFGPLLAGQVGHQVISRATVLAILTAFCLTLGAIAWWLGRRGDLAALGWIGPATALSASLLLVLLGSWHHSQVPPSAAVAQLVEATPGADEAQVSGLVALYTPGGTSGPLGAERGGVFLPDRVGQGGTTSRMVWTDLNRWHWENLALSPGLHLAPFEITAPVSPLSCRVTFGPSGVRGTASLGPFRDPADAILAFPSGRHLAARLTGTAGGFEAGSADQLVPGQFIASDLLTGEQQRRHAIYQQLLDPRARPRYASQPTFLTWAAPLDLGFTFMEQARRSGAALVAIPLEVERPAPGTSVLIPSSFLPYQGVPGEDLALLYDPKTDDWVSSRTRPGRTMLRFQVPLSLLPLQIERAIVTVDITAPGRPLNVIAGSEGHEVLATRVSPVGRLRIEINRSDVLRPDAGGGIYLGLAVGDDGAGRAGRLSDPSVATEWAIKELQLELAGQIPEE